MNLLDRVKKILISPKSEWDVIKNEKYSVSELFTKYAIILAAIPAVAAILGFSLTGVSTGFGNYTLPFGISLKYAVLTYVLSLAGAYLVAFIMDTLSPNFGAVKNMEDSFKVVVFSYTASWVGGIFLIIPSLSFLTALSGIYSLALLYMGMQKIKPAKQDKAVAYFVVTLVAAIIIEILVSAVVTSLVIGGNIQLNTAF